MFHWKSNQAAYGDAWNVGLDSGSECMPWTHPNPITHPSSSLSFLMWKEKLGQSVLWRWLQPNVYASYAQQLNCGCQNFMCDCLWPGLNEKLKWETGSTGRAFRKSSAWKLGCCIFICVFKQWKECIFGWFTGGGTGRRARWLEFEGWWSKWSLNSA